ncbi:hypothetical protein VFPPC_01629 [Pochonia chlamydosporia 170]|uniref:Uncharacterized protein n=1 Tax=Pochonia chlamydosporia 170 TaxID=1380566 RepID=A0A179G9I0_METCM|nr:hypothetical protein VFPPC_01629 [Pochonia chlamydosporia 170]OAQ74043.1 hypothetical protein VFPPC_01629 [Pochonia chlamydosporia 170]
MNSGTLDESQTRRQSRYQDTETCSKAPTRTTESLQEVFDYQLPVNVLFRKPYNPDHADDPPHLRIIIIDRETNTRVHLKFLILALATPLLALPNTSIPTALQSPSFKVLLIVDIPPETYIRNAQKFADGLASKLEIPNDDTHNVVKFIFNALNGYGDNLHKGLGDVVRGLGPAIGNPMAVYEWEKVGDAVLETLKDVAHSDPFLHTLRLGWEK